MEAIKRISSITEFTPSFTPFDDGDYDNPTASFEGFQVEEATNQHNCLVSYCDSYSNKSCQIYFLRKKSNPNISFVTIEVDNNNKLVQARTKFNELPNEEVMNTINKWLKSLIIKIET